jgi:hypothetical protein
MNTMSSKYTTRTGLALWSALFCLACVGCARHSEPWSPPPVVVQDQYIIDFTRLEGPDQGLGQLSDIAYIGDGRFLLTAGYGFVTIAANGAQGYRIVETVPFDPPPPSRVPGAKRLVDLDADGRLEAITRTGGLANSVYLYDDDGTLQWKMQTPQSGYPSLEALVPVQADHDPELELVEISDIFHVARLIQADGSASDEMGLPYYSNYHIFPIDVTGDGIDELLCALSKHVVLWSFQDGVLADLDLKTGRAISFSRIPGLSLPVDNQMQFSMDRFHRNKTGASVLTLSRSGDEWTLSADEFKPGNWRDPTASKGIIPDSASIGRDPKLWITVTALWTVVRVGNLDLGTIFWQRLTTVLPEHTVSAGSGAIDRDSDAPLEAWIVWMDGIWRLRVTETEATIAPE